MTAWKKPVALGIGAVVVLAAVYAVLHRSGAIELLTDSKALRAWIDGLGALGPLAIIGAMTVAIVFSPIPSAPIALAAGTAYGHGWGTLYVLAGAELGAMTAFVLARILGYEALRRWFGDRLEVGILGSQNAMMVVVFASRLLPFLSFDLVSYAAGLTPLSFWRFAVATLAGILPASFLLAHFGGELASGEVARVTTTVLVLGAITLVPVAIGLWRKRKPR